MSNEYKDWATERLAEETAIVAKYPFLRIRDIDGTADTNVEFPMIHPEIPNGWYKLFFQMCDDIKAVLEKEGTVEEFYFLQVKEKYNQLRCYSNGSSEVEEIIQKLIPLGLMSIFPVTCVQFVESLQHLKQQAISHLFAMTAGKIGRGTRRAIGLNL